MSKHWPRLAEFGSCDASIPWDARGFKTKTTQLPGRTQEEEDATFLAKLDEKTTELDKREKALELQFNEDLERSKVKEPRRAVPKVKVDREERRTGLRF